MTEHRDFTMIFQLREVAAPGWNLWYHQAPIRMAITP